MRIGCLRRKTWARSIPLGTLIRLLLRMCILLACCIQLTCLHLLRFLLAACRFAGAGLFDSLPSVATCSVLLDYSKEPIVWDRAAAAGLLWQCALAALAAEQAVSEDEGTTGQGQDVEGCVTADGTIWLLQARPQV